MDSCQSKQNMVFWGNKFSVCKFDGKCFSVSDMGRKKYSVGLKKYCFCRKKIMSRTKIPLGFEAKKNILTAKKNHTPPPPPSS